MTAAHRSGIAVAGNILTDTVKIVETYPEKGMLSSILSVSRAVGGCVSNTAIDLVKIDPALPVFAYGKIGDDDAGAFLLDEFRKNGVDSSGVRRCETPTSFSDVMSVAATGERTFFHYRGANAEFSPEDAPVSEIGQKMLHVGYILLLDRFDAPDPEYGTVMARYLKEAQDAGIKTSVDVVSDSSGKFAEKVVPALKYTHNAVMNEIEACSVAGLAPRREDGTLSEENIRRAMEMILSCGVKERVIVHCPEAGFLLDREGNFTSQSSLDLPDGFIKGTVGAGDAFCAGCLYGIYHDLPAEQILRLAAGAAACNLQAADSVSGMRPLAQVLEMAERYAPRSKKG